MTTRALQIGLALALASTVPAHGVPAPAPAAVALQRPVGAVGTVVVPDKFLRRWDPLTVFFDRALGPAQGGAEDAPERLVRITPAHPGAFRWLDARTLQFRPAEPWPALTRFELLVEGQTTRLATLMAAPQRMLPAENADGLEPTSEITLVFPEPLDAGALERMVSVELRPLPGVGGAGARVLSHDDFTVKTLERRSRADEAGYVLVLRQPIPLGTRALVRLRLALEDAESVSFRELAFATAEPFRVLALGCRARQFPVTPQGTRYPREQAIACGGDTRSVIVEFSATPQALGPLEARNLVRFTPAVPELSFELQGRTLQVSGRFDADTLYGVALVPTPLNDSSGRPLELRGKSELYLHFPKKAAYLQWHKSQGIVERLGPQLVPIEGRGRTRLDLRIQRVEPLDRSFWPFPDRPVAVDESQRPPGPGEEPSPHADASRYPSANELAQQVLSLGTPVVSTLVELPLRREGSAASFGLDLAPHLARIAGPGQPGTYLVGLRDPGGGSVRSWMRVQVTDLSLATLEEPGAVRFVVTSLSSAQAVPGARVRIEGVVSDLQGTRFESFADGSTDAAGAFTWPAPGPRPNETRRVMRLVVEKGGDVLVLDPSRAPDSYADNQWSGERATWLQWAFESLSGRAPEARLLAHVFSERPVYRPEEPVHLKGFLRWRERGRLTIPSFKGLLVVSAPGDLIWKYPVTLSAAGSFYHKFAEKDLPTGAYTATLRNEKLDESYGSTSFQIEAYRIPTFEVALHAPDQASLDREFEVSLTASYYAGGKVGGQPVAWRVTQFPYAWAPSKREGFVYSTDERYSRSGRFQASPTLEKEDTTSDDGGAALTLNPAVEPTAEPRSYVVEATVTGPDDQTVTATRTIQALPPFVLGLKVPRYLERATRISGELLVAGPDGALRAGQDVTVRLLRREWHSHLRASDFSDGVARYVTDVVDQKVSEATLRSGAAPTPLDLPIDRAGVYVVELESRDRLDRAQVVRVDLYAGGDQAVTWAKPVSRVFSVVTDKPRYDPGATAALVLKSPYQSGRVLAVIEAPEGNQYQWLDVLQGAATFQLPVKASYVPRVGVHFVLMRGRVPGTAPLPGNATDLGKPATLCATAWVTVNPVAHQAKLELQHPETARPGQKIDVRLKLSDPAGKPLSGEVTLWLVDQAVLSLGKERALDPVPDFIRPVRSRLSLHDTRNLAFGLLPFADLPGGDGDADGAASLLDQATVRRNFKSVPYYNPAIPVGPDGTASVAIELSDDLTNFKVRAKAVSGAERFSTATSTLPVRLPVIVQPALPRFVRPGDRFTAAAIGRIVEGRGGPGAAEAKVEGLQLQGPARRELLWTEGKPERVEFEAQVEAPPVDAFGRPARRDVAVKVAVSRASDGALDAFEVSLPLVPDRARVVKRQLHDLSPGQPLVLPEVGEKVRAGTLRRTLTLSSQPGLVRMAAGLDFLRDYPYGCTEQQISKARAYVALKQLRALLKQAGGDREAERAVKDTLAFLASAVDANGLVAYWPGSKGSVSLTAWVLQFLVEARQAGFAVDDALVARLTHTLQQALRSDYAHFIDGESFAERTWALGALAQAGQFDGAYAAELAGKAQYLDLEGVALVMQAFAQSGQKPAALDALTKQLWDGLVVRLHQGKEIYGGLQERRSARSGLVLPSETRTLAEVTRALTRLKTGNPRLPVLVQALVTLGQGDGWGTTNANASALLALSELLKPDPGGATESVRVRLDGREQTLAVGGASPLVTLQGQTPAAGEVLWPQGGRGSLVARLESAYVPAEDGSQAAAQSSGFVVSRELLRVLGEGEAPERLALAAPGGTHSFALGAVVEEHVQVVNPKERHYVAIVVPLAAGMEPLNPALATAPPEAQAKGTLTLAPTYVQFLDDQVAYYYNTLPAGTYDFYFRERASTPGDFIQPPPRAEMMYDASVFGSGVGARVRVVREAR